MAPTIFSGGKLNLKGSKKAKKKSKNSKHKIKSDAENREKNENEISELKFDTTKSNGDNYEEDSDDGLTSAERRSLDRKKQREREELAKVGGKSHRERVEEFNEKLGSLTEHNDIPRVRLSFLVKIWFSSIQIF